MDVRSFVAGARPGFLRTLLVVPLAALLLAAVHAAPASAAQKCATRIFKDWTDNHRIDRVYDLPCYRAAIKALPVDVRTYSSAEDDIRRAMLYAQSDRNDPGDKGPSPPPVRSTKSSRAHTPSRAAGGTVAASAAGVAAAALEQQARHDRSIDAVGSAIAPVDRASLPIPLPLIGLAAVSAVLLALGSVGYVTRRIASHGDG
jgi:hypothetical protein